MSILPRPKRENGLAFCKAHGLGNDFVMIKACDIGHNQPLSSEDIIRIADRHAGIGCDQIIIFKNKSELVDVWFYNSDGTEAETCGNGLRCIALWLNIKTGRNRFLIKSKIKENTVGTYKAEVKGNEVTVNMGEASFSAEQIPLQKNLDPMNIVIEINGIKMLGHSVSVGNPHIVFFVDDLQNINLPSVAPAIENHPYFPKKVNVSFAYFDSNKFNVNPKIHLRVWERGAKMTQACGSAACAVAAVANKKGLIHDRVTVSQPGGNIELTIDKNTGDIYQTATADIVFTGRIFR